MATNKNKNKTGKNSGAADKTNTAAGKNNRTTGKNTAAKNRKDIKASRSKTAHKARTESFKENLMDVDKQEEQYDAMFEQKLSEQYAEFKRLKDHDMQLKSFIRIFMVLLIIILAALLLISFS